MVPRLALWAMAMLALSTGDPMGEHKCLASCHRRAQTTWAFSYCQKEGEA